MSEVALNAQQGAGTDDTLRDNARTYANLALASAVVALIDSPPRPLQASPAVHEVVDGVVLQFVNRPFGQRQAIACRDAIVEALGGAR